jgi:drug/metabolite transporter (DMT)-like permease
MKNRETSLLVAISYPLLNMSYSASDDTENFLSGAANGRKEGSDVELDDMSTISIRRPKTDHKRWNKLEFSFRKQELYKNMWLQNKGVVLVLLSMFFAASMDTAVRFLEIPSDAGENPISTPQILFLRHILTLGSILIYGYVSKNNITEFPFGHRKVWGLLIARGVAGFVAVFGIYFSLAYLTLTDATVLTFIAPIVTCYANTLILEGESFNYLQQLASGISVAGVLVIAFVANAKGNTNKSTQSPPTSQVSALDNTEFKIQEHSSQTASASPATIRLIAILIALLGVIGQAGGMIVTRMIGPRAHPLIILSYSSLASIILCGIALLGLDVKIQIKMSISQWLLLLLATFCGFMFQLLLTKGLQYGASCSQEDTQCIESQRLDLNQFHQDDRSRVSENGNVTAGEQELNVNENPQKHQVGVNRAVSMMYTQAIFALIYDWVVWNRLPSLASWLGNLLVTVGALLVAASMP